MKAPEHKQNPAKPESAADAWWAGDQSVPLEIPLSEAPCICESLVPRSRGDVALVLRCVLMLFANRLPCSCIKVLFARLAGMRIGKGVYISPHVLLDPLYPQLTELADGALLGIGCRLLTHEYTTSKFRLGRVRIGRGAVVGAFSTVRSGVSVGDKATIGMHCFVNRDVAANDTVGGVPAKPLKKRGQE